MCVRGEGISKMIHLEVCWGGLLCHHKGVFVIGIGVCWEHLLCPWVCLDVNL